MKRLTALCLVLAACGFVEQPDAEPVGVLRQAGFPRMPIRSGGVDGAHLGISIAACRNNSTASLNQWFAAGAPGIPAAYLFGPQTLTLQYDGGAGAELGTEVVCQGSGTSPEMLAHGTGGSLFRQSSGSLALLLNGIDVGVMTRGDSNNSSPSLLGIGNEVSKMVGGGNPTSWLNEVGTGHRMACAAGTDLCVIANRNGGAKVYDVNSGSTSPVYVIDQAGDGGHSITAVAMGELHPAPGLEVAIADQGGVEIHSVGSRSQLLYTLRPPGFQNRFGTSLAIDRFDAGAGLSSLWIGSPDEARVYRFFGDAGTFLAEPAAGPGSLFGWAMATESSGQLLITAPKFTSLTTVPAPTEEGAIFRDSPDEWLSLGGITGVRQECDVSIPCRVNNGGLCQVGICIGGVVCGALGPASATCGDGGVDAGSDAGSDAGTDGGSDSGVITIDDGGGVFPVDAGSDAGQPDAGRDAGSDVIPTPDAGLQNDAGTDTPADGGSSVAQQFATCGCSSPALTPLLFIVLALARRRVGAGG